MSGMGWMEQAACRGADPRIFFPDEDGGRSAGGRPKAAAVVARYCHGCPVLVKCRTFADQHGTHTVGVWGGVVRWHRGARIARLDLLGRGAS